VPGSHIAELIRPFTSNSSPGVRMTHSLDQTVMARKAKARKCTTEIVGNNQAKVEFTDRLSHHS
jgi:hypothetical protein